jgi:hypothetical protein
MCVVTGQDISRHRQASRVLEGGAGLMASVMERFVRTVTSYCVSHRLRLKVVLALIALVWVRLFKRRKWLKDLLDAQQARARIDAQTTDMMAEREVLPVFYRQCLSLRA